MKRRRRRSTPTQPLTHPRPSVMPDLIRHPAVLPDTSQQSASSRRHITRLHCECRAANHDARVAPNTSLVRCSKVGSWIAASLTLLAMTRGWGGGGLAVLCCGAGTEWKGQRHRCPLPLPSPLRHAGLDPASRCSFAHLAKISRHAPTRQRNFLHRRRRASSDDVSAIFIAADRQHEWCAVFGFMQVHTAPCQKGA